MGLFPVHPPDDISKTYFMTSPENAWLMPIFHGIFPSFSPSIYNFTIISLYFFPYFTIFFPYSPHISPYFPQYLSPCFTRCVDPSRLQSSRLLRPLRLSDDGLGLSHFQTKPSEYVRKNYTYYVCIRYITHTHTQIYIYICGRDLWGLFRSLA